MQSHTTWGLIAQNNYWILSPHNDCFINNSRFKRWLHICFPKELCRGNNSPKLSLFLSCGTGRKGCRMGVTGGNRRDGQGLYPLTWQAMAPARDWVWTWVCLAQPNVQFYRRNGRALLLSKNVFKGYWRGRGEAGFPIKGKAVYRGVCVAPLKSLPQAFSACFRNSNGCGNLCAVRGTREVTTQMWWNENLE